jgi:diguanylate cyclase (GGDEF)-like protein/PAS domain S-box-containing protein
LGNSACTKHSIRLEFKRFRLCRLIIQSISTKEALISEAVTSGYDLKEALEQLDYTVLITDSTGKIEYVNAAFERASGYGRDELLGQTPRILTIDTLPVEIYDDIWRQLISGVPRRSAFKNRNKSGAIYEEDTSMSPIRDANGNITNIIWIGRPAERKNSLDLFRRLVDSSPTGVMVFRKGKLLFVNDHFKRLTGYRGRELSALDPLELVQVEDRDLVRKHRLGRDGNPYEYRLIHRDGSTKWVLETMDTVDFMNLAVGENIYTAATVLDISRRKAMEDELQYALTAYASTLEATTDGLLVIDTTRTVRQLNRRFADLWGLSDPKAYVNQPGIDLLAVMRPLLQDLEKFSELGRKVFYSDEEVDDSVTLIDGRIFEVHTKPQIIDGAIAGQVWSFRDVTEREHMQSTLIDLANLDSLTGIPGRNHFQEEVNLAISRGESGAVLFMDVDDFKAINDSLGHTAGDDLLRSLAVCLSRELRRGDLLARLGGDEFAALLRGANRSQAKRVAQRLLRAVREMKSVSSDQPFASTISIGGALFPAHGTSVDELLGHADMAMYQVKRSGRNNLHLYTTAQGSKAGSISRMVWKQRILDAFDNDRFVLYAQPIYELSTGRLGCYELLLRMEVPGGKVVLPEEFLPIAERAGLMLQIDAWVVKKSLAIAKQLATAPHPAKIAFNLSATAVGDPAFLDLIKKETSRLKLNPDCVSIEVTETALISDLPAARAFFHELKDLGFLLALDDFGAGFSSLSRLKEVPADYLKIDGSFVENVSHNQEDRHFIKAISDLATGLGIGAVAESVQDAEAVQILIDLGVLNGQGFYLGRPRPIGEVLAEHIIEAAA